MIGNDENKIKIEQIPVRNLHEFTLKYVSKQNPDDIDVISIDRALAQTHNPNAVPNDIGLLIAYEGSQCVGYLGLMPGKVQIGDIFEKIYWPTTFYVTPESRGLAGIFLVEEAMNMGLPLIITGMSDVAEKLYIKMGFKFMQPVNYTEINLGRYDVSKLLFKKYVKTKVCQFVYRKIKSYVYDDLKAKMHFNFIDFDYNHVDEKLVPIDQNKGKSLSTFYRSPEVINWMLNYKWINPRGINENDLTKNYNFSYLRDKFNYSAFEIYSKSKKQTIGYAVFSSSSEKNVTVVKLLDHYLYEEFDNRIVLNLALNYAKNNSADKLHLPDQLGKILISQKHWGSIMKRNERRCVAYDADKSSLFSKNIDTILTSYCDGDTPFT